jgi:hypothetical protein
MPAMIKTKEIGREFGVGGHLWAFMVDELSYRALSPAASPCLVCVYEHAC